jgi:hypothetical protein
VGPGRGPHLRPSTEEATNTSNHAICDGKADECNTPSVY